MTSFKDFGIKPTIKSFVGDKIKIAKILDKQITIHDFKITDSKVYKDRGNGKCLQLSFSFNDTMHVLFTSAGALVETIQKVPESGFPFETTIVKINERYQFT